MKLALQIFLILSLAPTVLLAHTEGMIVDAGRPPLIPCKSGYNKSEGTPHQELLHSTFIKLFNNIHPIGLEISSGPEEFCLLVNNNTTTGAAATVETGKIDFDKGLMDRFETEEALVAVLSHEFAHILMYHRDPVPFEIRATATPETVSLVREIIALGESRFQARDQRKKFFVMIERRLNDGIAQDEDPIRKQQALSLLEQYNTAKSQTLTDENYMSHPLLTDDSLYEDLLRLSQDYGIRNPVLERNQSIIEAANAQIEQLETQVIAAVGDKYSRKILSNFREREADEVGLELFVRAGYAPEKYEEGLLTVIAGIENLGSVSEAREHCLKQAGQIEQGENFHPHPCWRIENIQRELMIHQDYYRELMR